MAINRRTFSAALVAGAAASFASTRGLAAVATPTKARNVVLVHGLFADGSCWSEVIGRLQAAGLNATSVQNPLTTLPDAVASARRVLARQDGPTVLVGHSFSGMIVTEAGTHPNVSALVYVAAGAPDADEDYGALAKRFPTPPASAGIIFDGDEGRLGEEAFLHDFAGDLPEAKAKVLYAVQQPFQKALLTGRTTGSRTLHGKAHGRQDHRSKGKPRIADLPSRRDRGPDSGSRAALEFARKGTRADDAALAPGERIDAGSYYFRHRGHRRDRFPQSAV
jgi:pimeloyl-ACP methyl ester carboxylesterase